MIWALHQQAPTLPADPLAWGALLAGVVLYGINTLLRGERWQQLLREHGDHPKRRDTYSLIPVGYFGSNVLPARAGDVMRVLLMAPKLRSSRREVAGTVLSERLLDVAALAGMFAIVALVLVDSASIPHVNSTLILASAAALALGLVVIAIVGWRRRDSIRGLLEYLRPVGRSTATLWGRFGWAMLGMSLLIWLIEASVWWASGYAAGLDMTAFEAVYLVSMASLFSMIPSGPGYAGTLDAAAIVGAKAIGADGSTALTFVILVRFVLVVPISLVGLALIMSRYGGLRHLKALVRRPGQGIAVASALGESRP